LAQEFALAVLMISPRTATK